MPFKNNFKNVDYYMNQMGHGIVDSFTESQEKDIRLILAKAIRIPSKKIIDLNVPFWFIKKYYMQFYMGEDKRKGGRKQVDREKPTEDIIERNYRYFYSLIPSETAKSLNFEQKRAIQDILKRCIVVPTRKIYETNKIFKFGKKDYYYAFFLGYDKRKANRGGANAQMRGLNVGVRGFIYFAELAVAVGIIYALIIILMGLFNVGGSTGVEENIQDMIQDEVDRRLDQGYSISNPFGIIDYYWWNYFRPFI